LLTISEGATAVIDFGKASHLTLAGDLVNGGNLFIGSSNPDITAAQLTAANITNQRGALLTSVLPAGGVAGFAGALANLDLVLSAVQNILNRGTISSSGNLTMNAGGSIVNEAVISAARNVNLMSAIGNITNSGTIAAMAGSVNVAAQAAQNIVINNVGGTLAALEGAINVRNAAFDAVADIDVNGGNFLAKEINLFSGSGNVVANFDTVEGSLSTYGSYAHIGASTPVLTLGQVKVDGDPTFYNDAGNILITQTINVTENLAILASGNITATSGLGNITARNGTLGRSIYLVAGANLLGQNSPADTTEAVPPVPPDSQATGSVTVLGASSTGGDIDLTGAHPDLTINSGSTCFNCSGAPVTLVAFAGAAGGSVILPAAGLINSGGVGTADNGTVTIIAGAESGVAIAPGGIGAAQSTGAGTVSLTVAQPTFSTGSSLTFDAAGTITSGNAFAAGPIRGGDIVFDKTVLGWNTNVTTGGAVTANANVVGYNEVVVTAGSDITTGTSGRFESPLAQGTVTLTSTGGSIGTDDADRVRTTTANLVARAAMGDVFINETDSVNLSGDSLAMGTFDLQAGGNLSSSGTSTLFANDVVLAAGPLGFVWGAIASAIDSITVSGVGIQFGGPSGPPPAPGGHWNSFTAPNGRVTLISTIQNISNTQVDAHELVVSTPTGIGATISEVNDVILAPVPLTLGQLFLNAGEDITVSASVSATNGVSLTSAGGKIEINADVSGTTFVLVTANGNVTATNGAKLLAPSGFGSLFSQTGDVGVGPTDRVHIDTAMLNARAPLGNVYVEDPDALSLRFSQAAGTWDLLAGGDVTVEGEARPQGIVSATNVSILTTGGSFLFAGEESEDEPGLAPFILGTDTLDIQALGSILTNDISVLMSPSGAMTMTSGTGSIGDILDGPVQTDAGDLVVNASAAGQIVWVEELNSVNLGPAASSAGSFFRVRSAGDLSNTATVSAPISILESTLGGGGTVTINADVTSSGGNLQVQAVDGIVTTGSARLISMGGSGFAFVRTTGGNIQVNTEVGELAAIASAGSASIIELDDVKIDSGFAANVFDLVAANGVVAVTGFGGIEAESITVTTPGLVVDSTLTATGSAGTVHVQNPAGSHRLTVGGGGTIAAPGSITFTASADCPILVVGTSSNTLTLNAPEVVMNALEGIVSITPGATISASDDVTVNTCFFLNPNGIQAAGTVTFEVCPDCPTGNGGTLGGTIANTSGDVILTKNMRIKTRGDDLAVIASGSVIAEKGFKRFDLRGKKRDSGNLSIIAGFDFDQPTAGQVFDKTTAFELTGPSESGGDVRLAKVNINTRNRSRGGMDAGDVLIVAHGGTQNLGTIEVGKIKAKSRSGTGGDVTIIGEGGVETRKIRTNGRIATGTQLVVTAEPIPTGPILVLNGSIICDETFVPGAQVLTLPEPSNDEGGGLLPVVFGSNISSRQADEDLIVDTGDVDESGDSQCVAGN
jgi:adhesin HecA-like repeat protein